MHFNMIEIHHIVQTKNIKINLLTTPMLIRYTATYGDNFWKRYLFEIMGNNGVTINFLYQQKVIDYLEQYKNYSYAIAMLNRHLVSETDERKIKFFEYFLGKYTHESHLKNKNGH